MPSGIPQHLRPVIPSVLAFVNASTWEETHRILVREQQRLLSDAGEEAIGLLIQQTEQANTSEQEARLSLLTMHQALIHDARLYGIDRAWRAFGAFMRLTETIPPARLLAPPGRQ